MSKPNTDLANLVDAVDRAARNIAHAITPLDALPAPTPDGGRVGSLTEAVLFAGENLGRIADAIEGLANAVVLASQKT